MPQTQPQPVSLWSSLQAGPLQGGVHHLTVGLRRAEEQRLPHAGPQAARRDQVLEWDGIAGGPALGDVVGMEAERVTWERERHAAFQWRRLGDTGLPADRRQGIVLANTNFFFILTRGYFFPLLFKRSGREGGGEEKHQLVASPTHPNLGIEPKTQYLSSRPFGVQLML